MQKLSHIGVVAVFAVAGASPRLYAAGIARHLQTIEGPYCNSELGILEGVVFLLAAGLYRYDRRVHKFAIFLAGPILLAVGLGLIIAPGITPALWFVVWLVVLFWLVSSPVCGRFAAQRPQAETK